MMKSSSVESSKRALIQKDSVVHLGFLDGLRAVAAIYVVIHHALKQVDSFYETAPGRIIYPIFEKGHYAVDLFIVLSGFCLMLPVSKSEGILKGGIWLFYWRRIKRILPTYFLAMILSLILIALLIGNHTGTHWDVSIPVTWKDIYTHILLVHDLFYDTAPKINHAFWSIAVEWRIYYLFPLLVLLFRNFNSTYITVGCILVSVIGWYLLALTNLNIKESGINPHFLGLFCLGMLSCHFAYDKRYSANTRKVSLKLMRILLCIGMVGMAVVIKYTKLFPYIYTDLYIGVLIALFLYALSATRLPLAEKLLSGKLLVFMGTFAYSIYLIHAPLLQVLSQYVLVYFHLTPLFNFIFLFIVGTPLIVFCSWLFFLVAEKPFLRKKKIVEVSRV